MLKTWTDRQLTEAFNKCDSIAGVLRELSLTPAGGNYKSIQMHMRRLDLDPSSLSVQRWRRGSTHPVWRYSLEEILVENSSYNNTTNLRKRLLSEGVFKAQCSSCVNKRWMGEDIPLELDHINGVNNDNRLENLRLLCPNCHAQTPTYCSKNRKAT